jgi:hypothetical protein
VQRPAVVALGQLPVEPRGLRQRAVVHEGDDRVQRPVQAVQAPEEHLRELDARHLLAAQQGAQGVDVREGQVLELRGAGRLRRRPRLAAWRLHVRRDARQQHAEHRGRRLGVLQGVVAQRLQAALVLGHAAAHEVQLGGREVEAEDAAGGAQVVDGREVGVVAGGVGRRGLGGRRGRRGRRLLRAQRPGEDQYRQQAQRPRRAKSGDHRQLLRGARTPQSLASGRRAPGADALRAAYFIFFR